jgi:hypothetical protein
LLGVSIVVIDIDRLTKLVRDWHQCWSKMVVERAVWRIRVRNLRGMAAVDIDIPTPPLNGHK